MPDPWTFVLVAVVGFAGGCVGGLFGVGGGLLVVPLLLAVVPGLAFKDAKAASLLAIAVVALVGVLAHRRRGSVDLRRGAWLAAGGVLGAWLGVRAAEAASDRALALAFALVLVAVGARFALGRPPRARPLGPGAARALALAAGLVGGIVAGALGIGGGVVMVPALVAAGAGIHLAVGTSLVAVGANAAVATATHFALGYAPTLAALGLPLAAGSVPGSELGAWLAHRFHADRLRRAFGAFLLAVAAWVAWSAL